MKLFETKMLMLIRKYNVTNRRAEQSVETRATRKDDQRKTYDCAHHEAKFDNFTKYSWLEVDQHISRDFFIKKCKVAKHANLHIKQITYPLIGLILCFSFI